MHLEEPAGRLLHLPRTCTSHAHCITTVDRILLMRYWVCRIPYSLSNTHTLGLGTDSYTFALLRVDRLCGSLTFTTTICSTNFLFKAEHLLNCVKY